MSTARRNESRLDKETQCSSSTKRENLFLHNAGTQVLLLNVQHILLSHASMMDVHWAVLDMEVNAVGDFLEEGRNTLWLICSLPRPAL